MLTPSGFLVRNFIWYPYVSIGRGLTEKVPEFHVFNDKRLRPQTKHITHARAISQKLQYIFIIFYYTVLISAQGISIVISSLFIHNLIYARRVLCFVRNRNICGGDETDFFSIHANIHIKSFAYCILIDSQFEREIPRGIAQLKRNRFDVADSIEIRVHHYYTRRRRLDIYTTRFILHNNIIPTLQFITIVVFVMFIVVYFYARTAMSTYYYYYISCTHEHVITLHYVNGYNLILLSGFQIFWRDLVLFYSWSVHFFVWVKKKKSSLERGQ